MTDLINSVDDWFKTDVNAVQTIVNKYASVLKGTLIEKNIPYLAVIINISVLHLNKEYAALSADWKAWSVLLIKKMFEEGKLKKETDIPVIIDEFLDYKADEYEKYCNDIISVNDYERDRRFMYGFFWKTTNKKIGGR